MFRRQHGVGRGWGFGEGGGSGKLFLLLTRWKQGAKGKSPVANSVFIVA